MHRPIIPFLLVVGIILLLSLQCTLTHRWDVWGVEVRPELLPALLVYAAFTVNLPTALLLGFFAAVMYDSFSGGNFGASMIPYMASISIFCAVRPVFFRNRITTQFLSGFVFGFLALLLQWAFCGKFPVHWAEVFRKVTRLAVCSGFLAVIYFTVLDIFFRLMGLNPGRFEDGAP
ncbi:MAG: hypothetical protein HY360_11075 [Verrucomicrobia bacterium]|nr:hypothetical protein [Verrucomicrobiota bacterium]